MNLTAFRQVGILFFCLLSTYLSHSQEAISASGGNYFSSQVSLEFTVGELVISTVGNSQVTITQGFHQSFSEAMEVLQVADVALEMELFPNPTSSMVSIHIKNFEEEVFFQLFNLQGQQVMSGKFNTSGQLDLTTQAKGLYQLLLTNKEAKLLNTFKIQLL
ncbi:MAG: T9SS type A sorting domain-containing protein [Cyclobacteriaceae bacterium]